MKKFLTVLLALSVVFTYTVGTAFAAVPSGNHDATAVQTALDSEINAYKSTLEGNKARVLNSYSYDSDGFYTASDNVKLSKAAVDEAITAFIDNLVDDMQKVADKEVAAADLSTDGYTADQLATAKENVHKIVTAYGAKAATYKYEKKATTVAEDVTSLFVKDGDVYKAATGIAVKNTKYFTKTDATVSVGDSLSGDYYVLNSDNVYEKTADANAEAGKTYCTFTEKNDVEYGTDVTGTYEKKSDNSYEATTDTNAQPGKAYYNKVVDAAEITGKDLTVVSNFKEALDGTGLVEKAEVPKSEAYYTAKIDKDYVETDYPATGAYTDSKGTITGTLTPQEAVSAAKAEAVKAIKDAKKVLSAIAAPTQANYTTAIKAYAKAYADIADRIKEFKDANGNPVMTIADQEEADQNAAISAAEAVAKLKSYAVGPYYTATKADVPATGATKDLSTWAAQFGTDIYVQDKNSNAATIFGVKVADIAKVTRSEAQAVNKAFYATINDTLAVAENYLKAQKTPGTAVNDLYDSSTTPDHTKFTATVKNAYVISDKYQEVVDYGAKLKNTYKFGEKIYDDAKVDAVVKAAEAIVYADLKGGASKTPEAYIIEAIKVVYPNELASIDTLKLDNSDALAKFEKTQKDASAKFDGYIVNYGDKKTEEADKKYKADYYAASDTSRTSDDETYADIKAEAKKAIAEAQSYADIEKALTVADGKLAQLLTKENEDSVTKLRGSYKISLSAYIAEKKAFIESADYDMTDFDAAKTEGEQLIDKAGSVEAVKDAFEKAKAVVDSVKPTADLKTAKESLEALIKALPLSSKVALADADQIAAAREAYDAYAEIPGAPAVSNVKLVAAEKALTELEKKALEAAIDDINKKIDVIGTIVDDKAAEAAVALKAEAQDLEAKIKAHNDKVDDLSLSESYKVTASKLDAFLAKANTNKSVYGAEIYLAEKAINAIGEKVETADPTVIKDAKKTFDALTDKQQYIVDNHGYADKLAAALANIGVQVEALKITASSTAGKGYIKVKWSVKGVAAAADGYQVYRSTKRNSGFGTKPYFTTKNLTYKNTKALKKGTRYYYKVRAYVEIDGQKYYSDWSNKAYRIAK